MTINATQKLKLILERHKNMGKGENAGKQHFLLFPQCFQEASSSGGWCELGLWGKGLTCYLMTKLKCFRNQPP